MDEAVNPRVTFKAIGHQWYWSYECHDRYPYDYTKEGFPFDARHNINFDSNLLYEQELRKGEFRLLQVDNALVLPIESHIRLIITSLDVLHSWTIPHLGVKVDACPGRLNQVFFYLKRPGVFYGQCSELCGVNHGFMPIVLKAVSFQDYEKWLFIGSGDKQFLENVKASLIKLHQRHAIALKAAQARNK